jgi:hypothetical protein
MKGRTKSVAFSVATSVIASASSLAQTPPIALSFDSPNGLGPVGVLYDQDWSLTLRANMANALLHISRVGGGARPFGENEFIVLTDPDDCLDLRSRTVPPGPYTPDCPGGADEEILDVHVNEHDAAGRTKRSPLAGEPLIDMCRGSAELLNPAFDETLLVRVLPRPPGGGVSPPPTPPRNEGPFTESATAAPYDCYGYGSDDDLPGLVIMADIGAARFYTPAFDRVPQGIRNMAGLLSSVTHELSGGRGSSVVATMFVKPRFFDALVMIDAEVTRPPWIGYDFLQRVDGGPVEGRMFVGPRPPASSTSLITNAIANSLPIKQVIVRAAIVRGRAPAVIEDRNGDRQYSAADLELMGHTLLSNEARIVVRATPASRLDDDSDDACPVPTLMYNDLDGSGGSGIACITGSSNSKVVVPR